MNKKGKQSGFVTQPVLQGVIALHQANLEAVMPKPAAPPSLAPSSKTTAELDQDAGGGFNNNHINPQQ